MLNGLLKIFRKETEMSLEDGARLATKTALEEANEAKADGLSSVILSYSTLFKNAKSAKSEELKNQIIVEVAKKLKALGYEAVPRLHFEGFEEEDEEAGLLISWTD